jgi:cytochrome c553
VQTSAYFASAQKNAPGVFMKDFVWVLVFGLCCALATGAQPPQEATVGHPTWPFLVADKDQPSEDETTPKHIPGSTKAYTQAQIDDLFNPPDWFPNERPPLPPVVARGSGKDVPACASCHLMSGNGHPESANLAGLSAGYIEATMADFKSGARKDPARMTAIGKAVSEDDVKLAAAWFASLKPAVWTKVVEADTVPKTYVNKVRQRLPLPGGATEPIGNRIVEVPEDPARVVARDPHAGFIAYVPPGSLAKGKELTTTGGSGKTLQCAICHGEGLKGMGQVPRIAGLSPVYVGRQLYNFQSGQSAGPASAMMKTVVDKLTDDDIVAISAYVASLEP